MPAGSESGGVLVQYGPILVAAGGILMGIVAAFTRKDKRQTDQSANLDQKTNTALKGLEAALDRSETERAYWQTRAETAEARADAEEARADKHEKDLQDLHMKIEKLDPRPPRQPRKPSP